MKPKFVQISVSEQNRPDYRQARAVLKYKPDIIIFENVEKNSSPETVYNRYSCKNKPIKEVLAYQKFLKRASKRFGDALSDVRTWENIMKLWHEEHDVLIYNVDAPDELRREFFEVWNYMYPCALKNWLWWVQIYLREKIMAKHVSRILKKYNKKENPMILICLQSFHWRHVKFLMTNPSKSKIWKYYFGRFPETEVTRKNIAEKIKKENKIFYKYWKKVSGF